MSPFDGPDPEMIQVEFTLPDGRRFIDKLLVEWIEREGGSKDSPLDLQATRALIENLWVIESSATRQGTHIAEPDPMSFDVRHVEDDGVPMLSVHFSELP